MFGKRQVRGKASIHDDCKATPPGVEWALRYPFVMLATLPVTCDDRVCPADETHPPPKRQRTEHHLGVRRPLPPPCLDARRPQFTHPPPGRS